MNTTFVPCPRGPEKGCRSPGTGVRDCCGSPCGCWELSPVVLQEQPGLFLLSLTPALLSASHTITGHALTSRSGSCPWWLDILCGDSSCHTLPWAFCGKYFTLMFGLVSEGDRKPRFCVSPSRRGPVQAAGAGGMVAIHRHGQYHLAFE